MQTTTNENIMSTTKKKGFDLYGHVNKIIKEQLGKIKDGTCHYLLDTSLTAPFNPISGTQYTRTNWLLLYIVTSIKSYRFNAWATYKQVTGAGGTLRDAKGKSEQIIYFNRLYYIDGKKADYASYSALYKSLSLEQRIKRLSTKSFLKYSNIFNWNNIDGLDHLIENIDNSAENIEEKNTTAKEILDYCGADIVIEKRNVASYKPSRDIVSMPQRKHFKSEDKYYSTLFHELGHWTLHKSRLNRIINHEKIEEVAFEELVAELTSAYLCAKCGMLSEVNDAAAYIDHWLGALENDETFFYRAIQKAQDASDFILEQVNINQKAIAV